MTKICFVAAPLIARSGVYNSTVELVEAGRAKGLDWTAVIGTSAKAGGVPANITGVRELAMEPTGPTGVQRLSRALLQYPEVTGADLIVSMIPQSDMALALSGRRWVAYLRGLPWPAPGESSYAKAMLWKALEKLALTRAAEVWATTSTLSTDVGSRVDRLVPPGLRPPGFALGATHSGRDFVWAARYSVDKNPALFLQALRNTPAHGVMFGSGPMETELRSAAPANVTIAGWRRRDEIWMNARAYVGTSSREAFGRSAVEAAMLGIPVLISDEFGCAEMLYTDPNLSDRFVLPINDAHRWRSAIESLSQDDDLHREVADHVHRNAARLTVESAVENVSSAASSIGRLP